MSNRIPPINTRGRYSVSSPFTTQPNRIYVCSAIRKFVDLENQGIDVFKTYYEPLAIARPRYENDRTLNAAIVTLTSDDGPPIYIPSTYIASYPDQGFRQYRQVVVSLSLGALSDDIDLTHLKNQMSEVASSVVGVTPTVNVGVSPIREAVTPEDHEALEAARQSRITNRETDWARVVELQQQNQRLQATVNGYLALLKSHGVIPE